jgi:hypothetical protein
MEKILEKWPEIVAVLLSPLIAWVVTIWYQNRSEKRKAKRDLFLVLMAKRKTYPPPMEFVDALNKIEVVFQDNKKVRQSARDYISSLTEDGISSGLSNSMLLDMLSDMANVLGYKDLRQTQIDRFYSPNYLSNQQSNQDTFWQEYIRILFYSKSLAEGFSPQEMERRRKEKGLDENDNPI